MRIKTRKYKAVSYPLYSIQLVKKRNNVLCLAETSNIKDGTEPLSELSFDMVLFGKELANSKLLSKGDKLALCQMFMSYLDNLKHKQL